MRAPKGHDLPTLLAQAESAKKLQSPTAEPSRTKELHTSALEGTASDIAAKPQPAASFLRRRFRPIAVAAALAGVILLGVVLTLTNRHGTLTIETDDPNVQVAVKQAGEVVEVLDAKSGWSIRLKAGKYDVETKGSQDRFELDQDTVTVKRGDKVRVKVTLKRPPDKPGEDTPVVPSPTTSPEDKIPPDKDEDTNPWPSIKIGPPVPRPKPVPIEIEPEPLPFKPGESLSPAAVVTEPAAIDGVRSWTVEPRPNSCFVWDGAFSPDGSLIAAGLDDGYIRLWNTATGQLSRVLMGGHEFPVTCVAWSSDGRFLVSRALGPDPNVNIWDTSSGLLLRSLQVDSPGWGRSLAWSPDGSVLAVGDADGAVQLWDFTSEDGPRVLRGHKGPVRHVVWSPDGKTLVSGNWVPNGSADCTAIVWDVESGQPRYKIPVSRDDSFVAALCLSPDGKVLAVAESSMDKAGTTHLLELATGKPLGEVPFPATGGWQVGSLTWSPYGQTFTAVTKWGERAWDTKTGAELERATGGRGERIEYSPDGKTLAWLGGYTGVLLWRSPGRFFGPDATKPTKTLSGSGSVYVGPLGFSRDGGTMGTVIDGRVELRDIVSGELVRGLPGGAGFFALSPGGTMLASVTEKGARICTTEDGQQLKELQTESRPKAIAWSPDEKMLVTAGATTELWEVASGKRLRTLSRESTGCAAWSPDGKSIALIVGQKVFLLDPLTGRVNKEFSSPEVPLESLAWSSDGKTLAGGGSGQVLLFDVQSGNLRIWKGPAGGPICWFDDGKTLASSDKGWTHGVWDVASGKLHSISLPQYRCCAFSPEARMASYANRRTVWQRRLDDGRVLRTLLYLPGQQHAVISPDGHFRGSPGVEKELVYVVQTETGQETLTPAEFSERYGWKNDPERVTMGLSGAAASGRD